MKKSMLAVAVIAVMSMPLFAAPKAAPAYAGGKNMAGKSAIGAGYATEALGLGAVSGIGFRHWNSNETAFDVNVGFASGKDTRDINLGGQMLFLLKGTANVHYMSMFGLQYASANDDAAKTKQTDLMFGAGLNVEFFFSEMPDLGFNATLTGITVDMRTNENNGVSTSSTNVGTSPLISFGVRYYYK